MIETLTLSDRAQHEGLLEKFHREVYLSAFAEQSEPLDVWKWALWGDAPYRMLVRLALDGGEIVGGITFEHYRRSNCGVVTYVVVAPQARRSGLGKELRTGAALALYAAGARAVFGEVNDPRVPHSYEPVETTWQRLQRYMRWGSRVLDMRYAQPSLGPGLERDRGLVLLRHGNDAPPPSHLAGSIVREFISEYYEITEDTQEVDAELRGILDGIPEQVRLFELTPAA